MPCQGPSDHECRSADERAKRARLLNYLLAALGKPENKASKEAAANPWSKYFEAQTHLCALLKSMTQQQIDAVVYNPRVKDARDLADFWEKHQEEDRIREEREASTARFEQIRASALSKLTAQERSALGLK